MKFWNWAFRFSQVALCLNITACLFGGEKDHTTTPPKKIFSDVPPALGWYRGDYGPLAKYGIESDLVLSADSLQFIGIRNNDAAIRMKAKCISNEDYFFISEAAISKVDIYADSIWDPWHAGVFKDWNGLSDFTDTIEAFTDGTFRRMESVVEFYSFIIDKADTIPHVLLQSPRMWVYYYPIIQERLFSWRYDYFNVNSDDPTNPFNVYRDIDLRGCRNGQFSSHTYFLGGKVWGVTSPNNPGAWWGYETEAVNWKRIGSFIMAENFQQRQRTDTWTGPWVGSPGEYLLRISPFHREGIYLWWSKNFGIPGFWTPLILGPEGSCSATNPQLPDKFFIKP